MQIEDLKNAGTDTSGIEAQVSQLSGIAQLYDGAGELKDFRVSISHFVVTCKMYL